MEPSLCVSPSGQESWPTPRGSNAAPVRVLAQDVKPRLAGSVPPLRTRPLRTVNVAPNSRKLGPDRWTMPSNVGSYPESEAVSDGLSATMRSLAEALTQTVP